MLLIRMTLLLAVLAVPTSALEAQRRCVKGKPCGNSCIAQNRVCRVGAPKPAETTPARTDSTPAAARPLVTAVPMPTDSAVIMDPDRAPFVGDASRKIFYRRTCALALRIKEEDLVVFFTDDGAKKAGYARSGAKGC